MAVVKLLTSCLMESDDVERWKGGGDRPVAKGKFSDTAETAKLSSSSSSSMTSSGITNGGSWVG